MKCHLVIARDKRHKYTHRTLCLMAEKNGIEIVEDAQDADCVLVSIDDPDDLNLIKRARKLAGTSPVIAGGFEGFGGEYLLAYADAVNVGEGFEFFESLGKAQTPSQIFDRPFMLTRQSGNVEPSYRIDQDKLPLVRITEKAWYYLAGRGCKGKCSFCETSFVYPRWENSQYRLKRALEHAENQGHRLTFITNDSVQVKGITSSRNTQSVRVIDYLKSPQRFKSAAMLHFGIEGFSEKTRRQFNKPISDDAILELIEVLGENKQQAEFFFLTGWPNTYADMMRFAESVSVSAKAYPRIFIKLTRLDPSPHTPLWTYDLRQLERLSDEQIDTFHNTLKARNIRFRLFQQRSDSRQTWRAMLRRCSPDEVEVLGREPEAKQDESEFIAEMDRRGIGHLLTYDGRPMPNSQIAIPHRALRDRFADKLGMMPVVYKVENSE